MITGIRFLNFQGFFGDQRAPIGQITAIFGPNSSGKSSISRGLKILDQSLGAYKKGAFVEPVWQSEGGATTQSFKFGKNPRAILEHGVGVRVPFLIGDYSEAWFSLASSGDDLIQINEIELTFPDCEPGKELSLRFESSEKGSHQGPILRYRDEDARSLGVLLSKALDPLDILTRMDVGGFTGPQGMIRNAYPELYEVIYNALGDEFFEALNQYRAENRPQEFEEPSEATTERLSNFRPHFEELVHGIVKADGAFMLLQDETEEHEVRKSLESLFLQQLVVDVVQQVKSALDYSDFSTPIRTVPEVPVVLSSYVLDKVNSNLAAITNGRYSLEVVDQSVEDLYRIEYLLRDHFTGILSSFANAGQGLTQVLEVLFSLEASTNLVFLEQPDLHLHPFAIGALTSLIVEDLALRMGERQVLIETHSETILTRLQKEKRISSEFPGLHASDFDLKILYCEPVQGEPVDDQLIDFVAEAVPSWEGTEVVRQQVLESLNKMRGETLDMALLRRDEDVWMHLTDQEDFWQSLRPYVGFNSIAELRLDHLGDVIDPFPISFSDLRIQDLLQ